jgi:hypothetical protein
MRVRVAFVLLGAALLGGAAFYAHAASGGARIATCSDIRVSGGPYNGESGTTIAGLSVRNRGKADCTVNARPWIRVGPLRHAVSVQDATPGMFGSFGAPESSLTLRPGRRVFAQIFIAPGGCDRSVRSMFSIRARAGWGRKSVSIDSLGCKNGTGTIYVGSFYR